MAVLTLALGESSPAVAAEAMDDSTKDIPNRAPTAEAVRQQRSLRADQAARLLFAEVPRSTGAEQLARQHGLLDAEQAARLLFADAPRKTSPEQPASQEGRLEAEEAARLLFADAPRTTGEEPPSNERAGAMTKTPTALFQLPRRPTGGGASASTYPERPVIEHLTYQYSLGSESDISYRRDADLNKRGRDNSLIAFPQVNGLLTYRPTPWLETTVEVILEQPIYLHQEDVVSLPSGEKLVAQRSRATMPFNQAFVTIKEVIAPFQISVGRRNYEDPRHFLYDTSLDMASAQLKLGHFRFEALGGRPIGWDLDLLQKEERVRTDTYILYADYRGIEDIKLNGYAMRQYDREGNEGRPWQFGVAAQGAPSDVFSFWTQLAYLGGSDESKRKFSAYAIDTGGTYRFAGFPLNPNLTLGYAFGTGDGNPQDNKNTEFRQSGMQSNEAKFGGISDFKVYGEVLDPALSNLQILTAGLGIRPAPNVTVDLVYHRYRLDKLADEIRGSALTAQMNQDDAQLSKDVGSAVDVVLGIRNLFDVRRLGVDLRAGWFFPGKAFRLEEGDPDNPTFRKADKGISVVTKFWF